MTRVLRALVVDDEPPARARLRRMLTETGQVEIVAEAGTAAEATVLLEEHHPDVVFLDIQMPQGDGFPVVDALRDHPGRVALIFVTAFADYAVRAFDVAAVDYLLKPYSARRLNVALQRARLHVTAAAGPVVPPARRRDRLAVEIGGRIRLIDSTAVDYAKSERNYVRLHTGPQSHLIRETLSNLESTLDPACFLRVHRSLIVRLDRIREIEPLGHGEMLLRLSTGASLISGRAYRDAITAALGLR